MFERQGKAMALLADERMICCVREERMTCCVQADRKSRQQSPSGRLSWYFAQRDMPGLTYAATINGYVASGPDKTKGGKEDV